MNMHSDVQPARSAGYKVDISRGGHDGRVSSEWFRRPPDERYLSLDTLHASVRARADTARTRIVESKAIRVEANMSDPERLALMVPGEDGPVAPTSWSFGQLCSLVGAPSGYLRQLPGPLAGINMQHGLVNRRPTGTPYRRRTGTPFRLVLEDDGRSFCAGRGVGRA